MTLLAQVGTLSGMEALSLRGIKTAAGITVLRDAPTPSCISKLLPQTDHLFYSGHGVRGPGESGLVLVGDDGKPSTLSEDDILSHARLAPTTSLLSSAPARQRWAGTDLLKLLM